LYLQLPFAISLCPCPLRYFGSLHLVRFKPLGRDCDLDTVAPRQADELHCQGLEGDSRLRTAVPLRPEFDRGEVRKVLWLSWSAEVAQYRHIPRLPTFNHLNTSHSLTCVRNAEITPSRCRCSRQLSLPTSCVEMVIAQFTTYPRGVHISSLECKGLRNWSTTYRSLTT
jgi:hypothetical protein